MGSIPAGDKFLKSWYLATSVVIRKQWPIVTIVEKHGNTRYRVERANAQLFLSELADLLGVWPTGELARQRLFV